MKISAAEWQVMRIVWASGSVGAAEVIEALSASTNWNHRTIRTLLNRLVAKGALEAKLDGDRNIFRSRVEQSQCVQNESRSFIDRVFAGDAGEMLVHLIENEEISREQIAQLKALLNAKRRQEKKR